jgi:fumarate reductase iron-sulfur subunit
MYNPAEAIYSDVTMDQNQHSAKEAERSIIQLFALVYTGSVAEVEKRFGQEGFEAAKNGFLDATMRADAAAFEKIPDRSLKSFISWLLSVIALGFEYRVVERSPNSFRFEFTRCPWAEAFREVGRPDIGSFFCETDALLSSCFNPRIKFEKTRSLMFGDSLCDHHFYIE